MTTHKNTSTLIQTCFRCSRTQTPRNRPKHSFLLTLMLELTISSMQGLRALHKGHQHSQLLEQNWNREEVSKLAPQTMWNPRPTPGPHELMSNQTNWLLKTNSSGLRSSFQRMWNLKPSYRWWSWNNCQWLYSPGELVSAQQGLRARLCSWVISVTY